MNYKISCQNPSSRYIDIEFAIDKVTQNEISVQLPAWRPGRYELTNFAKNIQTWKAFDGNGKELAFKKITKDTWQIETKKCKTLTVKYNFYAPEINAGSTFIDENLLYVNPVNCLSYVVGRENEECTLELDISKKYEVATGLKKVSKHKFVAANFDELADSPVIASETLQHQSYKVKNVLFHIWFQGNLKVKWDLIIPHFHAFTKEQMDTMKTFPVNDYHFLFHALPFKNRHGVEHCNSTVITLGPHYDFYTKLFADFLEISSHELFHTWNIKQIRPVEMYPYDFTKENYSRLGYVAEGVTTYYGDYFLLRSHVYSVSSYFAALTKRMQLHFDNYGRFNLSVADASFDTWLDGYTPGIPNRKTSIYHEGCMIAFMTDILIRKSTANKNSLDDVMLSLYKNLALKNKGYSEHDYMRVVEQVGKSDFQTFFQNYVYGTHSYREALSDCLNYLGYDLQRISAKISYEKNYGFKSVFEYGKVSVSAIAPESPAEKAGLVIGDELIAVSNCKIENNLIDLIDYHRDEDFSISVFRNGILNKIKFKTETKDYYAHYIIVRLDKPSNEQIVNFEKWSKQKFDSERI